MVDKIWYNMEELIDGSEERGTWKALLSSAKPVLIET